MTIQGRLMSVLFCTVKKLWGDYMKKKIISLLLALFAAASLLILCSCSAKLKTSEQAKNYARMKYGDCELMSTENVSDTKVIYTMKDSQYGFSYKVTSSISDMNIDGSSFGKIESSYDDYDSVFISYILTDAEDKFDFIKNNYDAELVNTGYITDSVMIVTIGDKSISDASEIARRVASVFRHYDKKGVFSIGYIRAEDKNGRDLGRCSIKSGKWQTTDQEKDEMIINLAKNKKGSSQFIRKENAVLSDTGLTPDDVMKFYYDTDVNCPASANDPIVLYYFSADGKEYYIADFMYAATVSYYTNFDHVFNK